RVGWLGEQIGVTRLVPARPYAVALASFIGALGRQVPVLVVHLPRAVVDVIALGILCDFALNLQGAVRIAFLNQLHFAKRVVRGIAGDGRLLFGRLVVGVEFARLRAVGCGCTVVRR